MAAFRDDIMHNKEEFNNGTGNQYTVNDQVSVEELNYNIENGFYAVKTANEAKEIAGNAKEASDNFVSYATQTPTDAQKQQARDNIGASAKATNPIENNLASLDAEGNVKDSGIASNKVATKVSGATTNNLASLDANGNIKDSGKNPNNFMSSAITAITGRPSSNVGTDTICAGVKCGKVVCVQGAIRIKNQLATWNGLWSIEGLPKAVENMHGGTSIDSFTGNLPYITINKNSTGIGLQNRNTVIPANAWVNFWITYITND